MAHADASKGKETSPARDFDAEIAAVESPEEPDAYSDSWRDSPWLLLLGVVVIILITIGYGWWVTKAIEKPQDEGTFGDMFGALGAAFSGLALSAVAYSIYMQRKELQLTRYEMQIQTTEVRKATIQQAASTAALNASAAAYVSLADASVADSKMRALAELSELVRIHHSVENTKQRAKVRGWLEQVEQNKKFPLSDLMDREIQGLCNYYTGLGRLAALWHHEVHKESLAGLIDMVRKSAPEFLTRIDWCLEHGKNFKGSNWDAARADDWAAPWRTLVAEIRSRRPDDG